MAAEVGGTSKIALQAEDHAGSSQLAIALTRMYTIAASYFS